MFIYINNINQIEKCTLFANFFRALVYGKITYEEWIQINFILNNFTMLELEQISALLTTNNKITINHDDDTQAKKIIITKLKNSGILLEPNTSLIAFIDTTLSLEVSDIGSKFIKFKDFGLKKE